MKPKTPLEARGTTDDYVPFYKSLDSNSKLFKSITDTINLIKKDPTLGDHCPMQRFRLITSKNTR